MARLLVIEDDPAVRGLLETALSQAGHDIDLAATATEGLRRIHARAPSLVLLDVGLPDMPGTEVCRVLRRDGATAHLPIIFVSARTEEIDRVVAFELGADDYVAKPFSVRELLLRIAAVLRRRRDDTTSTASLRELGSLRIDGDAHRVWVDGREIALTRTEFQLLHTLIDRCGRVQSRADLLAVVWGGVPLENGTRTIDAHVKRLREKLGVAAAYVETVRGVGYRFLVEHARDRAG